MDRFDFEERGANMVEFFLTPTEERILRTTMATLDLGEFEDPDFYERVLTDEEIQESYEQVALIFSYLRNTYEERAKEAEWKRREATR